MLEHLPATYHQIFVSIDIYINSRHRTTNADSNGISARLAEYIHTYKHIHLHTTTRLKHSYCTVFQTRREACSRGRNISLPLIGQDRHHAAYCMRQTLSSFKRNGEDKEEKEKLWFMLLLCSRPPNPNYVTDIYKLTRDLAYTKLQPIAEDCLSNVTYTHKTRTIFRKL